MGGLIQRLIMKARREKEQEEAAVSSQMLEEAENYINKYVGEDYMSIEDPPANAEELVMDGIMLGDIAGSYYEGCSNAPDLGGEHTSYLFRRTSRVTDDSTMAWAIRAALKEIRSTPEMTHLDMIKTYAKHMRLWAKWYPDAGYGGNFYNWAILDMAMPDFKSCGDGSAMRSGIIGAICPTLNETITQAILSAMPTHSHPEGVKGAILPAAMVWLALHGYSMKALEMYASRFYPNGQRKPFEDSPWLDPAISEPELKALGSETRSVICQMAVPEAVANFLHSDSYESCIRKMLSYDCDADTVSAIAGGIAAAYYKNTRIDTEGSGYKTGDEILAEGKAFLGRYPFTP